MTLVPHLSREKSMRAIGTGAAGIVEKTTLVSSPNISYIKNFAFRPLWPRSIRLRVDNDARCFARAELLSGAGRGAKSLFALTIGTGIGRAYGKNGNTSPPRGRAARWRDRPRGRRRRNWPAGRKLTNFL